jgi:shikimate 5-dehydrogenase
MFDGEGFVRGMLRKGRDAKGARALVVGAGGVGSGIAAALAQAGAADNRAVRYTGRYRGAACRAVAAPLPGHWNLDGIE